MDTAASTDAPEGAARSPHIAAVLSFLWPGLGQWYDGRPRAAVLFALPVAAIVLILLWQVIGGVGQMAALLLTPSSALTVVILIGLLAAWRILSIADAMTVERGRSPFRDRSTIVTFGALSTIVIVTHHVLGYGAWAFYDASSRIFVNEISPESTAAPSLGPGGSALPSDAVSYTHLTLPTNSRV